MVQTIHIDGQSSGVTIKVGEKLTIAGVYAYDWRNQVALPYLQVFVVLGGASTASGAVATARLSARRSPPMRAATSTSSSRRRSSFRALRTAFRRQPTPRLRLAARLRSTVSAVTHLGPLSTGGAFARRGTSRRSSWSAPSSTPPSPGNQLRQRPRDGHLDPLLEGFGHLDRRPRPPLGCNFGAVNADRLLGAEISGS
jgi:hypothetical protein